MPWYPDKVVSIELLLKAARRAAEESSSEHPEDLMIAMVNALETSVGVIMDSYKEFSTHNDEI